MSRSTITARGGDGWRAGDALFADLPEADGRTLEILGFRKRTARIRRRGWLVRRLLLAADVIGFTAAFALAEASFGLAHGSLDRVGLRLETAAFLLSLPGWLLIAKLYGLYDRDEERTDHNTVDDIAKVFHLVTVGVWLFYAGAWFTGWAEPQLPKLIVFWLAAVVLDVLLRTAARGFCRRHISYLQNTLILGAGDVGQLIARKLVHHPEYGLNLIGFVDAAPRELRADLRDLRVLGGPDRLVALIGRFDVERVIVAFSQDDHATTVDLIRRLGDSDVQVDIVPRFFEVVGPRVDMHAIEGVPLVGVAPARIARTSRYLKRVLDLAGAALGLLLASPLFAVLAVLIRRDSPGPVFFRQTRLGLNMRPFRVYKFRSMRVDTDPARHEAYVRSIMDRGAAPSGDGLYKLDQGAAVTRVGRFLRRTSLDELPQLFNVLKGEMSLVGPRPCLEYETELFAVRHFERFLVPQGLTGLWQVTARGHSTFVEALDMDVAYVRSWSLGLDLWLLCRTPLSVLGRRAAR